MRRLIPFATALALVSGVLVPAASAAGAPDRELTVRVTIDERRVVPVGIDHAADWGDVLLESGRAVSAGLGHGTYVRRGIAIGDRRLGTQDTIQVTFPEGSLVFQAVSFWSGPADAALLGGTGQFLGARGSALVSGEGARQEWRITLLGDTGVTLASPTVTEYERELTSTRRIELAEPGSTVGNMTQTTGRLLVDDSAGIADYTATSTVVQDLPGDRERRAVQAMFEFGGGTLFVNGMIVAPASALPTAPARYAVSGGTGVYAGAAGMAEYLPGEGGVAPRWRFTIHRLEPGAQPLLPTITDRQVQTRYTRVLASQTAAGAAGDLVLAGGWTREIDRGRPAGRPGRADESQLRGQWAVSAQVLSVVRQNRAIVRQSLLSLVQYSWGADSVLVLGVTRTARDGGPAATTERAVIGGLGAYVGVSGSVSMDPRRPGYWHTTYDLVR